MIINRIWAMPNMWTFKIKPIKKLLDKYVGDGKDWIDPFGGMNSPAEYSNDLNSKMPTAYHMRADVFISSFKDRKFKGIIYDPPYSLRQISECYKKAGMLVTMQDTQGQALKANDKSYISKQIISGGYAISCGWNTNGFGKKNGFEIIEILLVAHGGAHNDTIVTVEKRLIK